MADKNKSDWDFKAINPVSYELEIFLPGIKNRLMKLVFDKTMKHVKKGQSSADVVVKWDEVKDFEVPKEYMQKFDKLIMTCVHKQLIDIKQVVAMDGICVSSSDLLRCRYERGEHGWGVRVLIGGDYFRKHKMKKEKK